MSEQPSQIRSGFAFGLLAYGWWGLVPLYFAALTAEDVKPREILAHRIVWSLPVIGLLVIAVGGLRDVLRVLQSRKLVLVMLLSSSLLALNWLLYIFATNEKRVAEASLGYYMMPLVNAAFATLFLKEKLRPAHYPALALVGIGVAIPCFVAGYLPWLAVALPVTFGLYGIVRKRAPVESMPGLAVETLLLLPPSLAYLIYLTATDANHYSTDNWSLNALIMFSGIVTVVPLLAFTLSLRRLPLLAVSFIQFLSPTVQMLIAVTWLGEPLTPDKLAAFVCIWLAVALFIGDALWQARAKARRSKMQALPALPALVTR